MTDTIYRTFFMSYSRSGRRNFKNQNFSGQDLRGKKFFAGADLRGANFSQSNLHRVDFSGAEIQGATFRGANLREAIFSDTSVDLNESQSKVDFSNADIRGADFTDATLVNADFTEAKTGLSRSWRATLYLISISLCLLSSFPTAIVSTLSLYFFRGSRKNRSLLASLLIGIWAVLLTVSIRTFLIISFSERAVGIHVGIGISMILLFLFGSFIATVSTDSEDDFGGLAVATIASVLVLTLTIFRPDSLSVIDEYADSLLGSILNIKTRGELGVGIFGAVLGAIFGCWFSRSAISPGKRFSWLWTLYVRLVVYGGTLFNRTDLTNATFTGANLRGSNFKNAKITQTRWQGARSLDYARVGSSYLRHEWR